MTFLGRQVPGNLFRLGVKWYLARPSQERVNGSCLSGVFSDERKATFYREFNAAVLHS